MYKKGTGYSEKFKKRIVQNYYDGQTVSQLSSKYNVSRVSIYKWIKQFPLQKSSENEKMTVNEYLNMKKYISELEKENEILKKAAVIFAKNLDIN